MFNKQIVNISNESFSDCIFDECFINCPDYNNGEHLHLANCKFENCIFGGTATIKLSDLGYSYDNNSMFLYQKKILEHCIRLMKI